jgi:hypothetical protein
VGLGLYHDEYFGGCPIGWKPPRRHPLQGTVFVKYLPQAVDVLPENSAVARQAGPGSLTSWPSRRSLALLMTNFSAECDSGVDFADGYDAGATCLADASS